ncbi:MAG: type IV pilus modification PilV family protein [Thermodesulfobacteriota bacterium]
MNTHPSTRTAKRQDRGFSFVDVLIGLAIFSIGILAVVSLQVATIKSNSAARKITDTTLIGVNIIENFRTLPYDHADLDPTANPHQSIAPDGYICTWTVAEIDMNQDGANETKQVDITIRHPRTNEVGFQMEYLVAQEGI